MITGMGWKEMKVGPFPFDPSVGIAGGQNRLIQRNASSLSTDSSEFEFDSRFSTETYDEAPVSPKLVNLCSDWDHWPTKQFMISDTNIASAESHSISDQHCFSGNKYSKPSSAREGQKVFSSAKCNIDNEDKYFLNQDQKVLNSAKGKIEVGQEHINDKKERTSLGSLLNRTDIEQLHALTAYNKFGFGSKKQKSDFQSLQGSPWQPCTPSTSSSCSSSFVSPSSTTTGLCRSNIIDETDDAHHFNDQLSGADADSYINYQKKPCRKWALIKLNFLRRTVPRSEADHRGAEKLRLLRNQESDQPIVSYATAAPRKSFESISRGSTCSSINYGSSADSPMVHHRSLYTEKRGSKSAPMSPAHGYGKTPGSPSPTGTQGGRRQSRGTVQAVASAAGGDHYIHHTRPRQTPSYIISPHVLQYYEQQRARAEELKRRTSLPYRQSQFGACFFPSRDKFHTKTQYTVRAGQH